VSVLTWPKNAVSAAGYYARCLGCPEESDMAPDVRMEMPAGGWETPMLFLPFGMLVVLVLMESLLSSDGGARMR